MKLKFIYWLIVVIFTVFCVGIFLYINTDVIDLPSILQNQRTQYYKIQPISGQVMDAKTGAPLSNIPIELIFNCQLDEGFPFNPCGKESKKVFTNQNGEFLIPKHFINFPYGLRSFSLRVNMPTVFKDFSLTYTDTGLRNKLENGFFPYLLYYRETNFSLKDRLIFAYHTHQKIPELKIYLVPPVEDIFDCANLKDEKSRTGCISIFSLRSMEQVMSAGSIGLGAPNYFEKYFALDYDRQIKNTCHANSQDYFCIAKKAITENNASICDAVGDNTNKQKNDCQFIAAIELGKGCERIKTLSSNYYHGFNPIYSCNFYSAIRHVNPDFCEKISDQITWRPGCFEYLAKMKKDASLCYKLFTKDYISKNPQYSDIYKEKINDCLEDIKNQTFEVW